MKETFNIAIHIPDTFSSRERQLAQFAYEQHHPQIRKYTHEPYIMHLLRVSKLVQEKTNDPLCTAAALGHDLLEDTNCTKQDLQVALRRFGYSEGEVKAIISIILELTDQFVKEAFPDLNRRQRKEKEAARLQTISVRAANVKMADIIDNTHDLAVNDPAFAKTYMRETGLFIPVLEKGNAALWLLLQSTIEQAEWQINGR